MKLILQVFYSLFSGLLLSLALPNELFLFGCPFFTILALIPFYYSIKNASSFKTAFLLGFLQMGFTHFCSSFWLAYFQAYAAVTLGASTLGTALIGAAFGLAFYLPYAFNKGGLEEYSLYLKFTQTKTFKIVYFAAVYTVYEFIKSTGFLGYPWATLSATIFKWPVLMQIASITGTYGITFLLALTNALLAELLLYLNSQIKNKLTAFSLKLCSLLTAVLFAITLLYGTVTYTKKRIPQKTLNTIIVQQNSDSWDWHGENDMLLELEDITAEQIKILKDEEKKPELILWSEGALNYRFPNSLNHYQRFPEENPLIPFIKKSNTTFITGGAYVKSKEKGIYNNAALVFDSNGNFRGYYAKNHLVPFAEALPGMEIPAIKKLMAAIVGSSSYWSPGDQYTLFDIPCSYNPERILPAVNYIDITVPYSQSKAQESKKPTVKVGLPICYDDAFPDIMGPLFMNGAELFLNLTNDSWSRRASSEYQHFVVSSYRCIEYRTTMVRSTNSGYSVVIDPAGKVLTDMPLFERTATTFEVPVYEHKITFYARFKNWLPSVLLILMLIYFFCVYKDEQNKIEIKSERNIAAE